MGTVLDDYPGREKAMKLAGHDFEVIERPVYTIEDRDGKKTAVPMNAYKALARSDNGQVLDVANHTYQVVNNSVCWDIVDALVNQPNVKYETGLTLKGGALCSVLAWLDEPVQIAGDDSVTLPFVSVSWSHDGTASIRARSTNIRVVCSNTESAAEAQGQRLGTDFVFRHTKKVMESIEQAREAISGVRVAHQEYVAIMEEMARTTITNEQREWFIEGLVPLPPMAVITDRVANNVDEARGAVRALFSGPTIPEKHRFTAYGLSLAGVEYLDHLRSWKSRETYVGRSIMKHEPAKAKLHKLIAEVVAA
jgi:phage/plasmid-like protein (TIGR03299 family)